MRWPSKTATFTVLMVLSAIAALLLPHAWTDPLRGLFQPRVLWQRIVTGAARETEQGVATAVTPRISRARAEELYEENEALRRQVVTQGQRLEQQQVLLDDLSGLAGQAGDALRTIVVAPVVSFDADRRRETLLVQLNKRTRPHVRVGQWVAAGAEEGPTREVVSRQWLIGQVCEVQTKVARVRLATDPGFRVGVRIAGVLADGTWQVDETPYLLSGRGQGRMVIDQAEADYYGEGRRVVVVPESPTLPFAMSLGAVTASRLRSDSPQHFDLEVGPWAPAARLRVVYILAAGSEE